MFERDFRNHSFFRQELLNAREGALSGRGTSGDGLFRSVEIVPGDGLDIRPQDKVRVLLPNFVLVFLGGTYGAAHHLENVGWGAAIAVLHAHGDSHDVSGPEGARGTSWDLGDETAIGQAAGANFDRLKKTRECTACSNRVNKIATGENDGVTGSEVGGDDCHGNAQVFELAGFEDALDQAAEALVAGESKTRNAPSSNVAKAQRAASSNDAAERSATGIGGPENAAHACPCDVRDGNLILFENLQHSQVSKSTGETAAESQTDPRPRGWQG